MSRPHSLQLPPTLVLTLLLGLAAGCVRGAATTPSGEPDEATLQSMSAGWIGCQPERVAISDAHSASADTWSWVATCESVAMVCSSSGEVRCSPLRSTEETASEEGAEPARVTLGLPPEVVACTERPVAVEGLFDDAGRLVELRPWPGETPVQRNCVTEALGQIDLPDGQRALVRFEPRDPWEDED